MVSVIFTASNMALDVRVSPSNRIHVQHLPKYSNSSISYSKNDLNLKISNSETSSTALVALKPPETSARAAQNYPPKLFNATFTEKIIQAEIMHDESVDKYPIIIMLFAQNHQSNANKSVQVYQYNHLKNSLKLKQTIKLPMVKNVVISFHLLPLKKSLRLLIVSFRGYVGNYNSHKIYDYKLGQEKFSHLKTLNGDYDLITATVVSYIEDEIMLVAGKTGGKSVTIYRMTGNDTRTQLFQKILFDAKVLALSTFFMDGKYLKWS